jgi:hypothetical protein
MKDLKPLKPYFIEIDLPEIKNEDFMSRIPEHRRMIQEWIKKGAIRSYNLSQQRDKLWVVMYGEGYTAIADAIASLPLAEYFKSKITELMFTENNSSFIPEFSLN